LTATGSVVAALYVFLVLLVFFALGRFLVPLGVQT
jgi:hypothetical protein